jgi:hypothetical protein
MPMGAFSVSNFTLLLHDRLANRLSWNLAYFQASSPPEDGSVSLCANKKHQSAPRPK